MLRKSIAVFISILCLNVHSLQGQTYDQLDEYLEAMAKQKKFIGDVLLAKGEKVVYHKAVGSAGGENMNTTDSQFLIGSITKTFTAIAIMQLAEEGKVSLSDPLSKYLSLFPNSENITVKHLLTHKSGIKSYTELPEMNEWKYNKISPIGIIEKIMDLPLAFEPGSMYSYSNSNYIILGLIIQQVSGMSYPDYLAANIFPKAGMTHSGMEYASAQNLSQGLSPTADGWQIEPKVHPSVPYAAGALYSNSQDMLQFSNAFFSGVFFNQSSTVDRMINFDDGFYGLGVYTEELDGHFFIGHNGGVDGYSSSWKYFEDFDLHMIILSNTFFSETKQVSTAALDAFEGKPVELPKERKVIDLSVEKIKKYEGRYELQRGFDIDVFLQGQKLFARATGQNEFELYAESDTSFFAMVTAIEIDFRIDEKNNEVKGLTLFQGGGEFFAPKAEENEKKVIDLDLADLSAVTGSYELQPGFLLKIFLDHGNLHGQATGQEAFELYPESRSSFFTIGEGIEIEFQFDENGDNESLILYQGGGAYSAKLVAP